jgi:hypothetical protein
MDNASAMLIALAVFSGLVAFGCGGAVPQNKRLSVNFAERSRVILV